MTPAKTRKPSTPSREILRHLWIMRQNVRKSVSRPAHSVRDNSVPWGPAPRSVAAATKLIEAMERESEATRQRLMPK